jgi:hypothetical protein
MLKIISSKVQFFKLQWWLYTPIAVALKPLYLVKDCIFTFKYFLDKTVPIFWNRNECLVSLMIQKRVLYYGVESFTKENVPMPIQESYIHYFHYCAQNNPHLSINLTTRLQSTPSYFLSILLLMSSKPRSSKFSLSFSFPSTKITYLFLFSHISTAYPVHLKICFPYIK